MRLSAIVVSVLFLTTSAPAFAQAPLRLHSLTFNGVTFTQQQFGEEAFSDAARGFAEERSSPL